MFSTLSSHTPFTVRVKTVRGDGPVETQRLVRRRDTRRHRSPPSFRRQYRLETGVVEHGLDDDVGDASSMGGPYRLVRLGLVSWQFGYFNGCPHLDET